MSQAIDGIVEWTVFSDRDIYLVQDLLSLKPPEDKTSGVNSDFNFLFKKLKSEIIKHVNIPFFKVTDYKLINHLIIVNIKKGTYHVL